MIKPLLLFLRIEDAAAFALLKNAETIGAAS